MRNRLVLFAGAILIAGLMVFVTTPSSLAQGRGHGGGGGGGGASPGGPPSGVGVDRGIGRSSDASIGRADVGRGNASDRSNARSETGLERARMANENLRAADSDLRKHPPRRRSARKCERPASWLPGRSNNQSKSELRKLCRRSSTGTKPGWPKRKHYARHDPCRVSQW